MGKINARQNDSGEKQKGENRPTGVISGEEERTYGNKYDMGKDCYD